MSGATDDELRKVFFDEPLDHEGTARCVLAMYEDFYRYAPSHGWLSYNGKFWEVGAEASVGRAAVATLRKREDLIDEWAGEDEEKKKAAKKMKQKLSANTWNVNGVRARLSEQKEIATDISLFDIDPDKLNVRNGVVDLRTGRLLPHDPSWRFTYCLDIDYKPEAVSEEWQQFLYESVEGDEMLDYLQTVAGYLLTGETSEEVMFYIFGPTRSGKGTFTETLLSVMQSLAAGASFRTFTADRTGDTQSFDLAPFKNKRLIVAGESRRNERLNEAVLKQVTGGDNIYCAFKYKDPFSYRPQFKIVLTSNHAANADATDEAVWARLQVIHFPHSKLGQEDKGLKSRLRQKEELEGVLAWMVSGAIGWYEAGINPPQQVLDLTAQQRVTANTVAGFIDDCCNVSENPDAFAPGTQLYNKYRRWCGNEGYSSLGRKNFTLAMQELGFDTDRQYDDNGKRYRGFTGLVYVGFGEGNESITHRLEVSQNGQLGTLEESKK